jgi:hypothetical protein
MQHLDIRASTHELVMIWEQIDWQLLDIWFAAIVDSMKLRNKRRHRGNGQSAWPQPDDLLLMDDEPSEADIEFAMPLPTPEGIRETQALYNNEFGRRLTEAEARDVLHHITGIVYQTYVSNLECSDTDSTQGNLTTTKS